ncbi:Outer membrane protein romA [Enhygromyxa salina]|uniref:Outer membrane protein romA n=1 Tax=Enhygromyxa salina TaxID=215803 RepID=A0A0C2D6P1_9BACT|nr:MBL fold metallo-hydrolase [Enhygromyxa salina]KIG18846.1 Outer membrane protein romA [Enhygromyxa salina]
MNESSKVRRRRRIKQIALGLSVVTLGVGAVVLSQAWVPIGHGASGPRLERMQASLQWDGGGFENPQPLWNDMWGGAWEFLLGSDQSSPEQPLTFDAGDLARFDKPPATGLRVTWLGHSTSLIEIDGYRVLTDPVWGERTSPVSWLGPSRFFPPPIPLQDLPPIDAVVISHDHYDHLDYPTIDAIKDWDVTFVVPLGVGAHLEYWGVPIENIKELDWWDRTRVGTLEIVCAPARHASGRQLFDQNATLWAGYALLGRDHQVFFSGDTGLFPGMTEIGEKLGPFDLTMIETGAYGQGWPDWHIGPEQAVRAHQMLRGDVMLPIHWGLFDLASHAWTEPIERTLVAAAEAGVIVAAPRPGESFEPEALGPIERWWPAVLWRTAKEYPIVSTKVD